MRGSVRGPIGFDSGVQLGGIALVDRFDIKDVLRGRTTFLLKATISHGSTHIDSLSSDCP